MQSINSTLNSSLLDINKKAHVLLELTEDLSLLDALSEMATSVSQAIETLSKQSEGLITENELMDLMANSDAIEILDEIVDIDAISELENLIFNVVKKSQDPVLTKFLDQLVEKIELRYNNLLTAVHTLNALLNVEG